MVSVIYKDNQFLVKGTFDMGIAGVFENKEYMGYNEDDIPLISIEDSLEDLREDLEGDYYWIEPLKPYLEDMPGDGASVAKILETYINDMEETARKNIKQINNYFWYQLLSNWMDCEMPFWEYKDLVLQEYRDKYTEEDYGMIYENIYNNEELISKYRALYEEFDEQPNDGSMEKTDVEALLRKMFPVFNFDKFIQTIKPDCMVFNGGCMHIQFSDETNGFFCGAYEEFDEKFTPSDWHNF